MNSSPTTPPGETDFVELCADDLIGTGTRRKCYRYPGSPELCIKVPDLNKYGMKQVRREEKIYRSLARRGASTARISRYHGAVETSLGRGYVFDAIRDPDGQYSKSFQDLLHQGIGSDADYVSIMNALEDYLIDENVLFYDVNPANVLCRRNDAGGYDPFIIDGLGDLVAIEVLNYSDYLVNRKIRRRWLRLVNRMRRGFPWMEGYQYSH